MNINSLYIFQDLRNLDEAKEKYKTENDELLAQLAAKDKILKEHEEVSKI